MFYEPSILVASDLSETSDLALRAAEDLRKRTNGKITVIHVGQIPQPWDYLSGDIGVNYYPENYQQLITGAIHQKLREQMKSCKVEGELEVLFGPEARMILEYSEHNHFDIIVLGHKGRGNYFHLGDVTAKIVAASSKPVLVINRDFSLDRIAGLVDPFRPEKKIFSVTKELSQVADSEEEIISLWPDVPVFVERDVFNSNIMVERLNGEKKKMIEAQLQLKMKEMIEPNSQVTIHAGVSPDEKIRDGLVRVLDEDNVDLAVMLKHQKGKLEKILLGSSTRGILDHWQGNLLVLPS